MLKETQRMTGKVKWYNEEKGFGFITSDNTGDEVFFHHTALHSDEGVHFFNGERLTFTIQKNEKGFAAKDVERFKKEKSVNDKSLDEKLVIEEVVEENLLQQSDQVNSNIGFNDLELIPELLHAIRDAGYVVPTPIQARAIPIVLKGRDLLGCAQTGTGKTAAFALPILQRLSKTSNNQTQSNNGNNNKKQALRRIKVLVLSPTRELAIQIGESFSTYGKYTRLKSTVIYGGVGQNPQVHELQHGVDILVATPGRLLDLMEQGHINLNQVDVLVLDEGDRMLDMGFIHDVRRIVKKVPQEKRQTLLFSATIPREVIDLAKNILHDPVEINISPEKPTLDIIKQAVFIISKEKKQKLLEYLLADTTVSRALVFTRTKHGANRVVKNLQKRSINADAIHGNKSQTARQEALKNFRTGRIRVLVATDVASRGLDVDDISHIIQFDMPDVPETYLHRIGRTARAGAGGTAFAFCEESERQQLKDIEKLIRMRVKVIQDIPYKK